MDVSENSGTPKSSTLTVFSIINHPFWDTPNFGNTHIYIYTSISVDGIYCVPAEIHFQPFNMEIST